VCIFVPSYGGWRDPDRRISVFMARPRPEVLPQKHAGGTVPRRAAEPENANFHLFPVGGLSVSRGIARRNASETGVRLFAKQERHFKKVQVIE
jgi:hypothetical protein